MRVRASAGPRLVAGWIADATSASTVACMIRQRGDNRDTAATPRHDASGIEKRPIIAAQLRGNATKMRKSLRICYRKSDVFARLKPLGRETKAKSVLFRSKRRGSSRFLVSFDYRKSAFAFLKNWSVNDLSSGVDPSGSIPGFARQKPRPSVTRFRQKPGGRLLA
jgi:hypothetical protein